MTSNTTKGNAMEILVPVILVGVWILLQAWVLPKMGIRT